MTERRRGMLTYGSICSGIEAPSLAWLPLGWQPLWFSEIEAFPSAVLKHHYPDVPNLGDFTSKESWQYMIDHPPDILFGGTPCQAFSVAGQRKSLDDDRGNLTLMFARLWDELRTVGTRYAVWENVPGVLNTPDNAFGCFLSGMVGERHPLTTHGGRWTNAGMVSGPEGVAAWTVKDAQHFGVPQRRRRVFAVVGHSGDFSPSEILFKPDSVSGHLEKGKEEGEETARGVGECIGLDGQQNARRDLMGPLDAQERGQREPMVAQYANGGESCNGSGKGNAFRADGRSRYVSSDQAGVVRAENAKQADVDLVGFHARQTPVSIRGKSLPLEAQGGQAVACYPIDTMNALGRSDAHSDMGIRNDGESLNTLSKAHHHAVGYNFQRHSALQNEKSVTLDCYDDAGVMLNDMVVRRLTPVECERLMGMPDNYTQIPWRGKPKEDCPDGPRYKAIGNSIVVPGLRWIGERIETE